MSLELQCSCRTTMYGSHAGGTSRVRSMGGWMFASAASCMWQHVSGAVRVMDHALGRERTGRLILTCGQRTGTASTCWPLGVGGCAGRWRTGHVPRDDRCRCSVDLACWRRAGEDSMGPCATPPAASTDPRLPVRDRRTAWRARHVATPRPVRRQCAMDPATHSVCGVKALPRRPASNPRPRGEAVTPAALGALSWARWCAGALMHDALMQQRVAHR